MTWNALDPVSPREIARNNAIGTNARQKNRNPFIDNNSYVTSIWGAPLGVSSFELLEATQIFPNPTTGTFSINYSTLLSSVKYQVFNSTGQVVTMGSMEMILPGSNQTIDLSEHADGVYLLRIESMEGIISKFVLKH